MATDKINISGIKSEHWTKNEIRVAAQSWF